MIRFGARLARQLWSLFVDDAWRAAALLAWIGPACAILPRLPLGAWSGPVLFAGIAALTLFWPRPGR